MWGDPPAALCVAPVPHPLLASKQSWIDSTRPPRGEGGGALSISQRKTGAALFFFLRNPSPFANRSPLLWRLAFVLPRSHPHKHASHQLNPTRAGWGGRGREHGARGRQCFFIIPPGSAGAVSPQWRPPPKLPSDQERAHLLRDLVRCRARARHSWEGRATTGE